MADAGSAHTSLYIYVRNQRVAYLDNPAAQTILDWLGRLDGEYVTSLVFKSSQGWLILDTVDDDLNLSLCNNKLEVYSSEVFPRPDAINRALYFMGYGATSAQ
ncbi:MAG: hypothetical protein GC204_00650 [Chloroflexi bacterium]|nr:hypothetical protein [Chloroflexota bacterium]